jgi:hypothetical protein
MDINFRKITCPREQAQLFLSELFLSESAIDPYSNPELNTAGTVLSAR